MDDGKGGIKEMGGGGNKMDHEPVHRPAEDNHRVTVVKTNSGPNSKSPVTPGKILLVLIIILLSSLTAPFCEATVTEDISRAKNSCELCAMVCTLDSDQGPGKPYDVCVKTDCKDVCDFTSVSEPENDLGVSFITNKNSYTVGDQFSITVSAATLSTKKPVSGASLHIEYYNQNTNQGVLTQTGTTDARGQYSTGFKWSENAAGVIRITIRADSDSYGTASTSKTVNVESKNITPPAVTGLQASFSAEPVSGTAPLTVRFTDTTLGVTSVRLWEFGDDSTGNLQTLSHTFQNPGSYLVTLTVRNNAGQSSSATKTITANMRLIPVQVSGAPLKANIYSTATEGPAPLRVDFSDISTGTIESRLWTFNEGYKSELANPSHTFREPGTYTIKLTVNDGLGQSDTASVTVQVLPEDNVTQESTNTRGSEGTTTSGQQVDSPQENKEGSVKEQETNVPITPGDLTSGLEAAIAGVIGGIIAIGVETGVIPVTKTHTDHISRDKMLIEEMKTRMGESNDVWKMQTEHLVRQQIGILKDNKYYVLNSTKVKSFFNYLIGNIGHSGYGFDNAQGWTGGNCDDFEKWGRNLYTEYFDESSYNLVGGSNLGRVLTKPYPSDMRQGELIGSIGITNGHGRIINTVNNVFQVLTNHTAVLVIRPNGERFVIDYWQSMIDGEPRIYTEKEWIDTWSERLGLEAERTQYKDRIFDNTYLTDRAGLHGDSGTNRLTDYIRNYLDGKPLSSQTRDGTPSPFAATLEEQQVFYERGPMLDLEENFEKYMNSAPVKKFLEEAADKETAKTIVLSFWREPW